MKQVVIFSGRFQPFHKGHFATYRNLLKRFPDADVYIATSNKTDNQKSPFNFIEKRMIITKMFKIPSNRIIQVKNPYNPTEILSQYPEDSTVYIASVGEKDEQRLGGKYFQPYRNSIELQPYPIAGYVYLAPQMPNAISGTDVRTWLSVKDETEAENGFKLAYGRFNKEIYTLVRSKLLGITQLSEMSKVDLRDVERFADTTLAPYDFEFGKEIDHFFQRLNDPRNAKQITKPEMIGFFKRLARNKKSLEKFTEKYLEFVISDRRTNINIPFINMANQMIAKTIMRKPQFKTPDPILQVESKSEEIVYIDFMNKKKGFRKDRIEFKGRKAYDDAVKWGRENIDNFKIDMIKFENIDEDITLPVNIGDTVLMGRFKNKKVTIKNIDKDEHDMPTINGKKAVTFRIPPKQKIKENIESILTSKYGVEVDIYERADYIELSKIIVPKQMRGQGIGSKVMKELIEYAKQNKKDIFLTPSNSFGGNKTGLDKFYKSLGFKSNSGRNRDFRSRQSLKLDLQENLILEGGSYGHMSHPFDIDMNLTFADLKTIVSKALDGELELAREKTDGQALAVSWRNGRLVAARNKGHLANSGENALTSNELISKFEGRGEISDAFKFAIEDLESAISQLSDSQKEMIFKNGKAFMNCEVIYPESANVIPYGQSLLVFHGTMEYDEKGNPISENPDSGGVLAKMIKDINADVQNKFAIQGPPVQTLPKNRELKLKKPYYFNKINQLQKEFGLSDSAGISEYHQGWWSEWIDSNSPSKLSKDEKEGLVKRWAFLDKSFRLKDLKDPQVRQWAEQTDKDDLKRITKENIMKFEDIFLGVGADVLSFMTSVLTVNPEAARKQMLSSLRSTIEDIQKSGDPSSIKKLEIELKRLQGLGGFEKIVPAEGIVFNYKGGTYKLTGAFAPLNQILGIFKYSR
jgi:predicted GNAT family acetyltransferase